MPQLIRDGFNFPFRLPKFGPWDEITGVCRPALPEEVYDYQQKTKQGGKKQKAAAIKFLLGGSEGMPRHILSWNVKEGIPGQEETEVHITEENLGRLTAPRLDKLVDIVSGYAVNGEAEADAKN